VARRLASAFGKSRTGGRIQEVVLNGLKLAKKNSDLKSNRKIWFTAEQEENTPIRSRELESAPTNKTEFLSEMEIRAAAKFIESESGYVSLEELVKSISRLLGYKRAGPDFSKMVLKAIS
jgi:hypothetical protein